jgi:anti-sigma factor RsiW
MRGQITPEEMQDYIEGRLAEDDAASVLEYLRFHPSEAAHMQALRRQAEKLRRFAEQMLNEPIPERFREIIERLRRES